MDKNNKLIPLHQNSLIPKVTCTLSITNKLILENNRKLVLEIFERNPKFFIDLISEYYPLNDELLDKDKWDWESISWNKSILWNIELINNFKNKYKWDDLSRNNSIPWTIELIQEFEDKWSWHYLSQNESIPWTPELIREFEDKWSWDYLSMNESIPWTPELIEDFFYKWGWNYIVFFSKIHYTNEIFDKLYNLYYENIFFDTFYGRDINDGIPWSIKFIKKYNKDYFNWYELSKSNYLPWTIKFHSYPKLQNKKYLRIPYFCFAKNKIILWDSSGETKILKNQLFDKLLTLFLDG